MSTNDETTVSFGIMADTSIPAGSYSNTITFTAIANYVPKTLTIVFNSNGGTGLMANQYIDAGSNQNLNLNSFSKDGYIFSGWNTSPDGTGTGYADGASYSVTPEPDNLLVVLYAQWKLPINQLDDVTYMQDLTSAQCTNSDNGAMATLLDKRDNNSYTIAKINGNCWMTQNLRLSGARTLTSEDSNVESSWEFPSTSLASGNSYTDARSLISSNTSYGGYYNYCAASAGTVCTSGFSRDATYSICPKGWRLPTKSEFSGITSYSSTFSPVTGGAYVNKSLNSTGSRGLWWSSQSYTYKLFQYYLDYDGSSLDATHYGDKSYGYSVRCIRSS